MEFDFGSQATILYIVLLVLAAGALFALILWIVLAFTVIGFRSVLRRMADSLYRLEDSLAEALGSTGPGKHPEDEDEGGYMRGTSDDREQ